MNGDHVVQMTQQGYDELVAELAELENVKLPAAVNRVALARAHGDLSENAEYHAAREDLAMLEGRLDEIKSLIQRAQVVAPQAKNGFVGIGTQVTVKIAGKRGEQVFHIVGEWEANPAEKKISEKSPLGQALFGKKVGDEVQIEVPAGQLTYVVQKVA